MALILYEDYQIKLNAWRGGGDINFVRINEKITKEKAKRPEKNSIKKYKIIEKSISKR